MHDCLGPLQAFTCLNVERVNEDGSKVAKAAFLPNVSLGLGTFKIGVGVVTARHAFGASTSRVDG